MSILIHHNTLYINGQPVMHCQSFSIALYYAEWYLRDCPEMDRGDGPVELIA